MTLPDGYVDPDDLATVAGVIDRVVRTMGPEGLGDLLARMPGTRVEPAVPGRRFRPATPASVQVGQEHLIVLSEPVTYAQVVGGIVLHRDQLTPAEVGPVVARLVATLAREQGSVTEVAAALTAVRGATESF